MSAVVQPFLHLVFPHRCEACGREADRWLCEACLTTLGDECSQPMCEVCGYPLVGVGDPCPQCLHRPGRLIRKTLRVALHDGIAKELVHRLKYGRRWSIASDLASLIHQRGEICDLLAQTDAIVPVPLHWWRYWQRGFNQSALLAAELARLSGHPVLHALRRVHHTHTQSTLQSSAARIRNMKGAFTCRAWANIQTKRVLLVDDVTTTGATLRAAARALRSLNPASVDAVVFTMADPR